MSNAVLNIINWFFWLAVLLSPLMIACSGIRYFLARGDKEKEAKAIKMFLCGLVILLIVGFIFVISTVLTPSPFTGSVL